MAKRLNLDHSLIKIYNPIKEAELWLDTPMVIYSRTTNYFDPGIYFHESSHKNDLFDTYPYPLLNTVITNFQFLKFVYWPIRKLVEDKGCVDSKTAEVREAIDTFNNYYRKMELVQNAIYKTEHGENIFEKGFIPLDLMFEVKALFHLGSNLAHRYGNTQQIPESEILRLSYELSSSWFHNLASEIWTLSYDTLSKEEGHPANIFSWIVKNIARPPDSDNILYILHPSRPDLIIIPPLYDLTFVHFDLKEYLKGKELRELKNGAIESFDQWIHFLKDLKRLLYSQSLPSEMGPLSVKLCKKIEKSKYSSFLDVLGLFIGFPLDCLIAAHKRSKMILENKKLVMAMAKIESEFKEKWRENKDNYKERNKIYVDAYRKLHKVTIPLYPSPPPIILDLKPPWSPFLNSIPLDANQVLNPTKWLHFFLFSHIVRESKKIVSGEKKGEPQDYPIECPFISCFGKKFSKCAKQLLGKEDLSGCRFSREEKVTSDKITDRADKCFFFFVFLHSGLGSITYDWE